MDSKKTHAQWTNKDGKVLILKCVNADGTSHNGFRWPERGPVECTDWDPAPICPKDGRGGGFFGWAWGIGFGDGLPEEVFEAPVSWRVIAADPAEVVLVGSNDCKVKFHRGEVVYAGEYAKAYAQIIDGQIDWLKSLSDKEAEVHSAGYMAPASSAGDMAPASSAGDRAPASSAGDMAPASSAGDMAPASSAGDMAPASSAGDRAPASAQGAQSSAQTCGDESPASCGPCAIASASGEGSTVTCEYGGICAVVAHECWWIPEPETVLIQRWVGQRGWVTSVLDAADHEIGQKLHVICGQVVADV
jgi:hypothetical protein